MGEPFDYYATPSQEIFDEIKTKSIELWQTYDNSYGYADEKVNRIKGINNCRDNAWFIVAMFDIFNQQKLFSLCSKKTQKELTKLFEYAYSMRLEP